MIKYINKIAMIAFTIFFISCAANTTKGVKTLTNKRGETFTFHGDGTASVKGPFNEDLGIHRTNNNDPRDFDKVQLIKEGNKSAVYIGHLGLKGGNELISAIYANEIHKVKFLLKKNSSLVIKDKDPYGRFALYVACREQRFECVEAILENQYGLLTIDTFTPNTEKYCDYTPLMYSTRCGYNKIVKLLLINGANVNLQRSNGNTALHTAIKWDNIEAMKLLLEYGADVNIGNYENETPISLDKNGILEKLLKNINSKNKNSKSKLITIFL